MNRVSLYLYNKPTFGVLLTFLAPLNGSEILFRKDRVFLQCIVSFKL